MFFALLAEAGLQPSMRAAGNCYDNAPMESFVATLKVEWTHPFTYSSNQFYHRNVELSVPSLGGASNFSFAYPDP